MKIIIIIININLKNHNWQVMIDIFASQAYREWVKLNGAEQKLPGIDLSPEQLFFVGFAQVCSCCYHLERMEKVLSPSLA